MLERLFKREPADIYVETATHNNRRKHPEEDAYHQELIRQYCLLRKSYKKHDVTYPEGLGIPGDREAGFLLAVQRTEPVPKVVAGFRLNEVPAEKDVPDQGELEAEALGVQADKIEKARLGNLYPGIRRAHHAVLNIDGAMFDSASRRLLPQAIEKLLEKMIVLARARGYDAVSFIPGTEGGLDKRITDFYKAHPEIKEHYIPITDYGTVTRKGAEKRVLTITLDHEIMKLLPAEAKILSYASR